jgi:putative phage-type endonuclease
MRLNMSWEEDIKSFVEQLDEDEWDNNIQLIRDTLSSYMEKVPTKAKISKYLKELRKSNNKVDLLNKDKVIEDKVINDKKDFQLIKVRNNNYYKKENIIYDLSYNRIGMEAETEYKNTSEVIIIVDDKISVLREQVQYLQSVPQFEQRTEEWYEARKKLISASSAGMIVGDATKSERLHLLKEKCGAGKPFLGSRATRWGQKYEPVATSIYENDKKLKVMEFGLIPHPTISFLGASPDGITADGRMLEIKCPFSRKITGIPLMKYWVQMQIQLEVCCLDECDFLECTFKEYSSREEYIDNGIECVDNYRGVIGIYIPNIEVPYEEEWFYPEQWGSLEEMENSIIRQCKEKTGGELNRFDYWYLVEKSCITVVRDLLWFHSVLPELEQFWNEVLEARADKRFEVIEDSVLDDDDDDEEYINKHSSKNVNKVTIDQKNEKIVNSKQKNETSVLEDSSDNE